MRCVSYVFPFRLGYAGFVLDTRVEAKQGERCRRALLEGAKRSEAFPDAKTRLTIAFAEPLDLQGVMRSMAKEIAKFDVLALEPESERAFASACANKHADVVSVRAGQRLKYKFGAGQIKAAFGNKISFEVCYADALRDSTSRMWFFNNAGALARATRGGREYFLISSGANRAMEVRSMHDVVNLATLFGMKEHAARNAMTTNVDVMLKLSKRRRDVDFSASEVTKMNVDG